MGVAYTVIPVTIASGATLSSEVDLGHMWKKIYIDTTGCASEVRLQAARASAGTYRQVYHPTINSATVAQSIFKIPSATSGGLSEIPTGLKFLKVEATAAVSNGNTVYLLCSD